MFYAHVNVAHNYNLPAVQCKKCEIPFNPSLYDINRFPNWILKPNLKRMDDKTYRLLIHIAIWVFDDNRISQYFDMDRRIDDDDVIFFRLLCPCSGCDAQMGSTALMVADWANHDSCCFQHTFSYCSFLFPQSNTTCTKHEPFHLVIFIKFNFFYH